MPLYRATTVVTGEAAAAALRDALDALAVRRRWRARCTTTTTARGAGTPAGCSTGGPTKPGWRCWRGAWAPDFTVERVDDRDWVAQVRAELTPVAAGRFVGLRRPRPGAGPLNRIGLEIEAAQAFGTGHHATTQGCLVALDRLARRGLARRGSPTSAAAPACWRWPRRGSGRRGPGRATSIRWHTLTARENVAANGVGTRVGCVTAAGFRHPRLQRAAPYDLVFANILAGPLRRLAPEIARAQAAGGIAILSGILARQAKGVACHLPRLGLPARARSRSGNGGRWCCGAAEAQRRAGEVGHVGAVRPMSRSWSSPSGAARRPSRAVCASR